MSIIGTVQSFLRDVCAEAETAAREGAAEAKAVVQEAADEVGKAIPQFVAELMPDFPEEREEIGGVVRENRPSPDEKQRQKAEQARRMSWTAWVKEARDDLEEKKSLLVSELSKPVRPIPGYSAGDMRGWPAAYAKRSRMVYAADQRVQYARRRLNGVHDHLRSRIADHMRDYRDFFTFLGGSTHEEINGANYGEKAVDAAFNELLSGIE